MWSRVRQLINPQMRKTIAPTGISAQILNNRYAAVSTDSSYQPSKTKATCSQSHGGCIDEVKVFHFLDHLRPTATGLDGLSAWFLRFGDQTFAAPIAQLFNRSLSTHPLFHSNGSKPPLPLISKSPTPPCYHNID